MRPLPRFWTTARGRATDQDGRPLDLTIWGWSTASIAEAAAVAADRLAQTRERLAAGQRLQSWAYYPRMPLREETLAEITAPDGTLLAIVSRNRYGAEVLNTDLFLVADVDLEEEPRSAESGGGLLGRLFGRKDRPPGLGPSGAEQEALERVARFAAANPHLGVHTYRTAAGLRVLVTGGDLPPGTSAAEAVLQQLDSDPIYVKLCSTHQTYRARLTPKPWRCGQRALSEPWPYADERRAEAARRWLERYEAVGPAWATTRWLSSTGPEPSAAEAQVIAWHDRVTRAREELPLA
ncbi:MAG: hypothetical protein GX555_11655 [Actinomycetales bacterium]|nr:hypothetical protein [Actinomycetales bacterium]